VSTRNKWLLSISIAVLVVVAGATIAAYLLSRRVEPFIRDQTLDYLRQRFASDVDIGSLHVSMPVGSPLDLLLRRGRGATVRVAAERVSLWHQHRRDRPPLFTVRKLTFQADLASLWNRPARVTLVRLEGLQIVIPPRGETAPPASPAPPAKAEQPASAPSVLIETVQADGARLFVLPKDPRKAPLDFTIHKLRLTTAGPGIAMRYTAELTNPKPPGRVRCHGSFGPWMSESPSQTPLDGEYIFEKADLGVFKGIAGRLDSTGRFAGRLDNIVADGETRTPDFRLRVSGNPVPLRTRFHAIIDGRNGNTLLDPVEATLGRTRFVVRGGVVRNAGEHGRTVSLDVVFREGYIEDLLRLAMKGPQPMLRGPVDLKVRIELPPGKGEIIDKLRLSGTFKLPQAHFTTATVQNKIDALSSRAQGRPGDQEVEEVPSSLDGDFHLAGGLIDFSRLRFTIPGAEVALAGRYTFDTEAVGFRGKLRLQARVSQMVTGWKRWALKPVDRFFSKEGAGTLLRIHIEGTRQQPRFGVDWK
jgi:hypothetical protein